MGRVHMRRSRCYLGSTVDAYRLSTETGQTTSGMQLWNYTVSEHLGPANLSTLDNGNKCWNKGWQT